MASSDLTVGALAQLAGGLLSRGILQVDSAGSLQLPGDVTSLGGGAIVVLAGALSDPAGNPALGELAQVSGGLFVETPLHTAAPTLRNHGFLELKSTLGLAGSYVQDGPVLRSTRAAGCRPPATPSRSMLGRCPSHTGEHDRRQRDQPRSGSSSSTGSGSPAAIDGTFKQSRQGSLLVDANGTGVGALAVSGSVTAAGPLTVSSPNLPPGGRYAVLTAPGFVGSFKLHAGFGETLTTSHTEIDLTVATTANADDPAVAYGGWTVVTTASATGGQVHESATAGDTASVTLPDLSAWDSIARQDGGLVDVLVDGAYLETDDTRAADHFKLDLPGLHTLTLRVAGAHSDGSTGNVVDVDAIEAGGNVFDDGQVTYDGWAPAETASGTLYRLATAATRPASYAFSGTSVSWVTQTGPDRGQASVQIDGVTVKKVNLYSATEKDGVLKTYAGLAAGSHTIAIIPLDKHSKRSTGYGVAVQGFLSS